MTCSLFSSCVFLTEDAEMGANKEKKSAKAKAAPPPIKGAQSIMGFFGKK